MAEITAKLTDELKAWVDAQVGTVIWTPATTSGI
ncbi:hypothetical protein C8N44_111124 [Allosediminivita pacifica]|uniref:Uncharacterized protein n=1 Tax=Allosediminivita pacifica TaxID=1267769 RepID=A0A2T6AVE9_9RHOB|nr:hypothetical protein C8N44_111124 [Allosediminivita pacifica]